VDARLDRRADLQITMDSDFLEEIVAKAYARLITPMPLRSRQGKKTRLLCWRPLGGLPPCEDDAVCDRNAQMPAVP
jgi:hypothetical protein